MTNSLAHTLHNERLNECITLDQFTNEMQTTYARHFIQDFMYYADQNHNKKMFRRAWLEVFVCWKTKETE